MFKVGDKVEVTYSADFPLIEGKIGEILSVAEPWPEGGFEHTIDFEGDIWILTENDIKIVNQSVEKPPSTAKELPSVSFTRVGNKITIDVLGQVAPDTLAKILKIIDGEDND